jgi:hypothetical protein
MYRENGRGLAELGYVGSTVQLPVIEKKYA